MSGTSDSLSQNEIDLLFGGGGGGGGGAGAPAPPRPDRRRTAADDLQVYDFRRPARISKDRKRSLQAMYGLLCKSLEGWLTGRVRDQIELELQSVEQLSFGEFMLALPSPCASYIVDVGGEYQNQGVIDFGHELAYFLVDRLLGGAGIPSFPDRGLSQLERLVVRVVAERISVQLGEAWKDYVELELGISGFESIPEMLQVANREDPVLVANIEVRIGDTSSLLLVCLPFQSLEKFFTGDTSRRTQTVVGTPEERAADRTRLESTLRTSRVSVSARLPEFSVPAHVLADLRPGMVLPTGLDPKAGLELFVANQRRFIGLPGRVGKTLAMRVTEPLDPEPDFLIAPGRQRQET